MSSFIFDKCVRITATFVGVWAYGQKDISKGVAIGPKSQPEKMAVIQKDSSKMNDNVAICYVDEFLAFV